MALRRILNTRHYKIKQVELLSESGLNLLLESGDTILVLL